MPVISTNNAANSALNLLNNNTTNEVELVSQLASGSRIIQAKDDASGLAIGVQLQSYTTVFAQDSVNVSQGKSILQSADGALAQISNVLQRLEALATEAASGQVTNIQRSQDINTEYTQLKIEITSIASSTTYAGQTLLSGSFLSNVKFLVGTNSTNFLTVSVAGVTAAGLLGSSGSTVSTAATALSAVAALGSAINSLAAHRAKVGAFEAQFDFSSQAIVSAGQYTQAGSSVLLDADVAQVKTKLSSTDVLTQAAVASLTQASQLPQELLRLIQA